LYWSERQKNKRKNEWGSFSNSLALLILINILCYPFWTYKFESLQTEPFPPIETHQPTPTHLTSRNYHYV
jgi:hypothetical protein